jgi:2-polyprenyl-3-methyl-5-hydroxy-6-metoxy-1,4-benzoquinol methylase
MNVPATGPPAQAAAERWKAEAAFFDRAAARVDAARLPIDPLTWRRYTRPVLRRRFSYEYRFRLLGNLAGRTLLDVGCGDGVNAVLLARLGARVTGLDVSPGALEVARRRAEVNGVADRVTLVCAPIEEADLPEAGFDIVWGDGILHHVLDDLERVVRRLVGWARPDGVVVFAEPINLNPTLRRLRRLVPVRTEATPGERPMVRSELDLVRRYVPELAVRHYALLGRLDRFVLVDHNYERSPWLRRGVVSALGALDWALLSIPGLRRLAGTCVMHGRRRQSDAEARHPHPAAPAAERAG